MNTAKRTGVSWTENSDTIEALRVELKYERDRSDQWQDQFIAIRTERDAMAQGMRVIADRENALRAEVARLKEALQACLKRIECEWPDGRDNPGLIRDAKDQARAALASPPC